MVHSAVLALARLRLTTKEMARDIGLSGLNNAELDVLSAALDVQTKKHTFSASELLKHNALKDLSRTTLYRAVQSLKEQGFFVPHQLSTGRQLTVNLNLLR